MSDFESLKADTGFAGALLRSAAGDAPSVQARRLAAASLGLVATTSVAPAAMAAGQALGTATTQAVLPAGVKPISALLVAKWFVSSFAVGVVASTSVLTAYEVVPSREGPAPTPHAAQVLPRASERAPGIPTRTQARTANEPNSPTIQRPLQVPEPSHAAGTVPQLDRSAHATSLPRSTPVPRGAPAISAASFPAPAVEDAGSLDDEIAWLEPARRSLKANDGRQALAALARATPHVRLLASEAAVMRVEALLLVGRRAEAERLAQPFLDQHPSSPHAQRLRRLLAQR